MESLQCDSLPPLIIKGRTTTCKEATEAFTYGMPHAFVSQRRNRKRIAYGFAVSGSSTRCSPASPVDYCYSAAFSEIAFHNRGGDMGSSRMRTPVAWKIALAMAAGGATMGASPTPRTP